LIPRYSTWAPEFLRLKLDLEAQTVFDAPDYLCWWNIYKHEVRANWQRTDEFRERFRVPKEQSYGDCFAFTRSQYIEFLEKHHVSTGR